MICHYDVTFLQGAESETLVEMFVAKMNRYVTYIINTIWYKPLNVKSYIKAIQNLGHFQHNSIFCIIYTVV